MGAISVSGSGSAVGADDNSRSLAFWARCFFCMLLVVVLSGAEPIFDRGGEFALDIGAEAVEALSVISLVGVPGRSYFDVDARLGWREGGNDGVCIDVAEDGVAPAADVSVLGEDATRRTFAGPPRGIGDCTGAADGVLAVNGGNAEELTVEAAVASGTPDADFPGTEIFARPARSRLSFGLMAGCCIGMLSDVKFDIFLFTDMEKAAFTGVATFEEPPCDVGFALLLSRAGKSSGWRVDAGGAVTKDCEFVVFEELVVTVDIFASCFVCTIVFT